jgi:hypothetical protein
MKNTTLFVLFLVAFSCEKQKLARQYTYEATFIDPINEKPIKGEFFSFYAVEGKGFPKIVQILNKNGSNYYSDINGKITVTFDPVPYAVYYKAESSSSDNHKYYITNPTLIPSQFLPTRKVTHFAKPERTANLRIKYKNVNPVDEKDEFSIQSSRGLFLGTGSLLTGQKVEGERVFEVYGSRELEFDIRVTKGGVEKRYKDKIFIEPWVTNEYVFNY